MRKLSFPFPSRVIDQFRGSRKWALMLIPLASVASIPLLLAWVANDNDQAVVAVSSEPSKVDPSLPDNLPPLSQVPAPPSDSGLKSPRALDGDVAHLTTDDQENIAVGAGETEMAPTAEASGANSPSNVASAPNPTPQAPPASTAMMAAPAPPVVHPPADYTPPPLEIRVGIQRDVPNLAIAVSSQGYLQDRQGQGLMTLSAGQSLRVSSSGNGLVVNGRNLPGVVWFTSSPDGYLAVNDRWYRGRVLLVPREDKVLAVNYVNLEEYLVSVVGSEMHATAPTEALKAQAIAARSYALVHMVRPASQWFDLGDTQRWQVYRGINSEQSTSHNAVLATVGQVLSHNGGVVESLYASTDEIVARVHRGRGMSQYGAYDLARQGYNYQQILNRYYPGVMVARVVLQN